MTDGFLISDLLNKELPQNKSQWLPVLIPGQSDTDWQKRYQRIREREQIKITRFFPTGCFPAMPVRQLTIRQRLEKTLNEPKKPYELE